MSENNPRETAFNIVFKVLEKESYANLEAYQQCKNEKYSELDKKFIIEIAYGTIKHRNTIDWILSKFVSRPLKKIDPKILNLLRTGIYQLLYMDKVPASAACNETVEIAKKVGHKGKINFVNGVLRSAARSYVSINEVVFPDIKREAVRHISLKYSHPEWLVKRWIKNFGVDDTIRLCKFNNKPPVNSIRVNKLRISTAEFEALLDEVPIRYKKSKFCPEGLLIDDYGKLESMKELEGLYSTQNEASMLVGHIVNPVPGQKILDCCAGPGSKTAHLGELLKNEGEITALDIHEHRLKLIEKNCSRLGISCAYAKLLDASSAFKNIDDKFDLILIDAPCSGTGVLNRRADARWRKSYQDVVDMSKLQGEIFKGVIPLLKTGGSIIYSTCTLEPEENKKNIERFLAEYPYLEQEEVKDFLPKEGNIFEDSDNGSLQILPYSHGIEGFFIARLKKCF